MGDDTHGQRTCDIQVGGIGTQTAMGCDQGTQMMVDESTQFAEQPGVATSTFHGMNMRDRRFEAGEFVNFTQTPPEGVETQSGQPHVGKPMISDQRCALAKWWYPRKDNTLEPQLSWWARWKKKHIFPPETPRAHLEDIFDVRDDAQLNAIYLDLVDELSWLVFGTGRSASTVLNLKSQARAWLRKHHPKLHFHQQRKVLQAALLNVLPVTEHEEMLLSTLIDNRKSVFNLFNWLKTGTVKRGLLSYSLPK